MAGRVRPLQRDPAIRPAQSRHDARRLQKHFLVGMGASAAGAHRRRGVHPAGPVLLVARPAQGRARAAGGRRDRPAGARAARRLVDGDLGLERAHRGRATAPRAASHDRGGDLRGARLRRRRARRAAEGEDGAARLRHFGVDLRRARLLPARSRRACGGPARRAHLQHLAAHGIGPHSVRGVPPEPLAARSSAIRRRRNSTTGRSPTPS